MPKHHLLRKIDEAVDFERLYEIVGDLYCKVNGRPVSIRLFCFQIDTKNPIPA